MSKESPSQQFYTPVHVDAEVACIRGHCKLLAKYLSEIWPPSPEVLKTLSRHLEGSDNWTLHFVVRNGRPPALEGSGWEKGQETAISRRLYLIGEGIDNQSMPQPQIVDAKTILLGLANALDPKGSGKWKLVFKRPRHGNPSTSLHKAIRLAVLGHRALDLKPTLKIWRRVDERLDESKPDATDSKLRKMAVRFVRQHKKK